MQFAKGITSGYLPLGGIQISDAIREVRQALANIVAVLAEAGAEPGHITRMTWYITDRDAYAAALADIMREWTSSRSYSILTARSASAVSFCTIALSRNSFSMNRWSALSAQGRVPKYSASGAERRNDVGRYRLRRNPAK